MGKYLEIKLGEGSRLETDCKLSAKKYPEVMRMDRLLECITQSKKKTIRLILQQFLLWSETKKNQKWLVTLAKAASQAHHSNSSNNPIPSAYSRKLFRSKWNRVTPEVLVSSHQAIKPVV